MTDFTRARASAAVSSLSGPRAIDDQMSARDMQDCARERRLAELRSGKIASDR